MAKQVILVAVADDVIFRSVAMVLTRQEYDLVQARTTAQAITRATCQPDALLVFDSWHWGFRSTEICSEVRSDELTKHIPIGVMSYERRSIIDPTAYDLFLDLTWGAESLVELVKSLLQKSTNPIGEREGTQ